MNHTQLRPSTPPPPETILVHERTIGCDGGGGALGHPLVYLTIGSNGTVDCPYCDRHYVLQGDGRDGH